MSFLLSIPTLCTCLRYRKLDPAILLGVLEEINVPTRGGLHPINIFKVTAGCSLIYMPHL